MVERFDEKMSTWMDKCFPWKTLRAKSSDPPWFTNGLRRKISQRKSICKREGRSARWRRMKDLTTKIIKDKKAAYFENIKNKAAECNNS